MRCPEGKRLEDEFVKAKNAVVIASIDGAGIEAVTRRSIEASNALNAHTEACEICQGMSR